MEIWVFQRELELVSKTIDEWRHLFAAVTALATLPGTLAERVGQAYWNHLRRITANPGLPPELRAEFARTMSRLESLYPTPQECDVDPHEAARIAKQILRLYDRMNRLS